MNNKLWKIHKDIIDTTVNDLKPYISDKWTIGSIIDDFDNFYRHIDHKLFPKSLEDMSRKYFVVRLIEKYLEKIGVQDAKGK